MGVASSTLSALKMMAAVASQSGGIGRVRCLSLSFPESIYMIYTYIHERGRVKTGDSYPPGQSGDCDCVCTVYIHLCMMQSLSPRLTHKHTRLSVSEAQHDSAIQVKEFIENDTLY